MCVDVLAFQESNRLTIMLEDTENWLYEEGEDQEKEIYQDKLSELKVGALVFGSCMFITVVTFCTIYTLSYIVILFFSLHDLSHLLIL